MDTPICQSCGLELPTDGMVYLHQERLHHPACVAVEDRITSLEAELAAQREAVALFAEEAASYREKQAARRRDSDDRYRECVDRHQRAMAAVDANPIASAAVEEGRKGNQP